MSDTPEAGAFTKRDLNDLIESFGPATAPEPTPAEKEIAKRVSQAEAGFRALVQKLTSLGITDGNLVAAGGSLRLLQDSLASATEAIQTIPVGKLGLAGTEGATSKPRAPRKPRESVPAVAETAPEEVAAEPALLGETVAVETDAPKAEPTDDGTGFPIPAQAKVEETPEEIDARIKASRAARSGPAAKTASAPQSEEGF